MILRDGLVITNSAVKKNLIRITNHIYKLLPSREEGIDWHKPLDTLIEEIIGMKELFVDYQDKLLSLLCKLQGLHVLVDDEDFVVYRRTIFECLGIINEMVSNVTE